MRTLILVAVAAMAFGSAANAKSCKDPATGKFVKCPAAAMAPATTAKATPAPMASARHPVCKVGVSIPCGNSCISKNKECHKPPA